MFVGLNGRLTGTSDVTCVKLGFPKPVVGTSQSTDLGVMACLLHPYCSQPHGCPPLRDVSQVVLAPFPDAAIEQQALMIASLYPSRFLMPTLSACSLHLYQDQF